MENVSYRVIRSDRKSISLQITREGDVVVRAPQRISAQQIDRFVKEHAAWLEEHLVKRAAQPVEPPFTAQEINVLADRARAILPPRVAYYAAKLGVSYNRITIRHQHTKWGSCSSKGNLNFNCLLVLTPPEVMDYIVVHELCHRKEMNHSARFWAEVARVMPQYAEYERWLKENGTALIRRLP